MSEHKNESATQTIQRERLEDIVEARRHCRQQFRRAREGELIGELGERGKRILGLHAVREYALELETLMHPPGDIDPACETDYWDEMEIGEVALPVPNETGRDRVVIKGVSQLVNNDWPLEVAQTVTREDPVTGTQTARESTSVYPPLSVSERAFRACNSFCAEVGLDVKLQDSAPNASFDYSDILEEGPPEGEA